MGVTSPDNPVLYHKQRASIVNTCRSCRGNLPSDPCRGQVGQKVTEHETRRRFAVNLLQRRQAALLFDKSCWAHHFHWIPDTARRIPDTGYRIPVTARYTEMIPNNFNRFIGRGVCRLLADVISDHLRHHFEESSQSSLSSIMGLFTAVIAACTVALVSSLAPKNVLIIQNKGGGQYTFLKMC